MRHFNVSVTNRIRDRRAPNIGSSHLNYDMMTPLERIQNAHEDACYNAEAGDLWDMVEAFNGLRTMEMDMSQANCPLGYCRQLKCTIPFRNFQRRDVFVEARIVGLRNVKEVEEVTQEMQNRYWFDPKKCKVVFGWL
jgi:hypothetical protein